MTEKPGTKASELLLDIMRLLPFGAFTQTQTTKQEVSMVPMQLKGIQFRHELYPIFPQIEQKIAENPISQEPSLDHFLQLFQILQINSNKNQSLCHIKRRIVSFVNDFDNISDTEKWKQLQRIYDKISKYIQEIYTILQKNDFDEVSFRERMRFFPTEEDVLQEDQKGVADVLLLKTIPNLLMFIEDILKPIFSKELGYDSDFLNRLFSLDSFLFNINDEEEDHNQTLEENKEGEMAKVYTKKERKIDWKYVTDLKEKYERIRDLTIQAEKGEGNQGPLKDYKIERLNIITSNVGFEIRYQEKEPKNKGKYKARSETIFVEVYDEEKPVFSVKNLGTFERAYIQQEIKDAISNLKSSMFDAVAKRRFEIDRLIRPLFDCEVKQKDVIFAFLHSEKGFIGFLLNMMPSLILKLKDKIEKFMARKKVEKDQITHLMGVHLQIFSTRDACPSCEVFLSRYFGRIFQCAFELLKIHFPDIKIYNADKPDKAYIGLTKIYSYNLEYSKQYPRNTPEEEIIGRQQRGNNGENEKKFEVEANLKSFFSYNFLNNALKTNTEERNKKWTYFLSLPSETSAVQDLIEKALKDQN